MDLHNAEEENSNQTHADWTVDSVARRSNRPRSLLKGFAGCLSGRVLRGGVDKQQGRLQPQEDRTLRAAAHNPRATHQF